MITAWTTTGFAYWHNIYVNQSGICQLKQCESTEAPTPTPTYIGQSSHQSNFRLKKKSRQEMKMYRLFIFFSAAVPHKLSLLNVRPCVAWLNHLTRKMETANTNETLTPNYTASY
jgi:hypothetical protein